MAKILPLIIVRIVKRKNPQINTIEIIILEYFIFIFLFPIFSLNLSAINNLLIE